MKSHSTSFKGGKKMSAFSTRNYTPYNRRDAPVKLFNEKKRFPGTSQIEIGVTHKGMMPTMFLRTSDGYQYVSCNIVECADLMQCLENWVFPTMKKLKKTLEDNGDLACNTGRKAPIETLEPSSYHKEITAEDTNQQL